MFDFAETTKDMTASEILNYYRNLYYAEPQVTERGIMANAINDYFDDVAPKSEVAKQIFEEIEKHLSEKKRAISMFKDGEDAFMTEKCTHWIYLVIFLPNSKRNTRRNQEMTDNYKKIVQTLKNHIEAEDCVTCESFGNCNEFLLTKNTLDLITRQQSEIERLQSMNQSKLDTIHDLQVRIEQLDEDRNNYQSLYCLTVKDLEAAKSEAVKDFAEKFKEQSDSHFDYSDLVFEISENEINNLVKEMVGDMNENH